MMYAFSSQYMLYFTPRMLKIAELFLLLDSQTHAELISHVVRAAIGREHYILNCVADALFLAVRNFHKSN